MFFFCSCLLFCYNVCGAEEMEDEIIEFERVLDLACKSKYIMVDKRISDILKCIAASEQIYEMIKQTLVGFDFGKELKLATNIEGHFAMPNDNIRIVALSFCILNAIDDKKIEITKLLSSNFSGEDSYAKFCDQVFLRFKTAALALLGKTSFQTSENKPSLPVAKELIDRALFLANQLDEYVKPSGKKYYDCFLKSLSFGDKTFIEVFFELLRKNVSRKGKTLIKEIRSVVEVIVKQ